jgi:hypothetical protein
MIGIPGRQQMNYEEIVAGLRNLQASDFDCKNLKARGWERLAELTDALMATPDPPEDAIPELFSVMERLPDADLGSPGPLVHARRTPFVRVHAISSNSRCVSTGHRANC